MRFISLTFLFLLLMSISSCGEPAPSPAEQAIDQQISDAQQYMRNYRQQQEQQQQNAAQAETQFEQASRASRHLHAMELCSCEGLTVWVRKYVESRDEGSPLIDERAYNSKFTTMPPTSIQILDEMLVRIYDSPSQTPDEIAIKFNMACEKEMPSDPNECPHSSHGKHNTQTIPQAEKALDADMRH
jgi:hypothetical protein